MGTAAQRNNKGPIKYFGPMGMPHGFDNDILYRRPRFFSKDDMYLLRDLARLTTPSYRNFTPGSNSYSAVDGPVVRALNSSPTTIDELNDISEWLGIPVKDLIQRKGMAQYENPINTPKGLSDYSGIPIEELYRMNPDLVGKDTIPLDTFVRLWPYLGKHTASRFYPTTISTIAQMYPNIKTFGDLYNLLGNDDIQNLMKAQSTSSEESVFSHGPNDVISNDSRLLLPGSILSKLYSGGLLSKSQLAGLADAIDRGDLDFIPKDKRDYSSIILSQIPKYIEALGKHGKSPAFAKTVLDQWNDKSVPRFIKTPDGRIVVDANKLSIGENGELAEPLFKYIREYINSGKPRDIDPELYLAFKDTLRKSFGTDKANIFSFDWIPDSASSFAQDPSVLENLLKTRVNTNELTPYSVPSKLTIKDLERQYGKPFKTFGELYNAFDFPREVIERLTRDGKNPIYTRSSDSKISDSDKDIEFDFPTKHTERENIPYIKRYNNGSTAVLDNVPFIGDIGVTKQGSDSSSDALERLSQIATSFGINPDKVESATDKAQNLVTDTKNAIKHDAKVVRDGVQSSKIVADKVVQKTHMTPEALKIVVHDVSSRPTASGSTLGEDLKRSIVSDKKAIDDVIETGFKKTYNPVSEVDIQPTRNLLKERAKAEGARTLKKLKRGTIIGASGITASVGAYLLYRYLRNKKLNARKSKRATRRRSSTRRRK